MGTEGDEFGQGEDKGVGGEKEGGVFAARGGVKFGHEERPVREDEGFANHAWDGEE